MGDVIDELKQEGHLTPRQYEAGVLLLALLQAGHGTSAGVVGQVADKIDGSRRIALWPPGGGESMQTVDRLLKGMRGHERELFRFLVTHRELPHGSLADWGRVRSAYKTNKTRKAVTVGRVGGLLDSIAELCLPATSERSSASMEA